MHRCHAVIGYGDDIGAFQVGRLGDLFEIVIRDLIGALEIFRVTLAFGAILETLLARVDQTEFMASLVRLHLIAHHKIEFVVLDRQEHRVV